MTARISAGPSAARSPASESTRHDRCTTIFFPAPDPPASRAVRVHGIADSESPAQAAAYEINRANLIRDLRKDLASPRLPVVIAALKMGTGTVHAAHPGRGGSGEAPRVRRRRDGRGHAAVFPRRRSAHPGEP
ncbi:MAG: sialate O-acetylesterase [Planctomycetaceae bacterium]